MATALRERLDALARAHALTLPKPSDDAPGAERSTALHALVRTILSPYEDSLDGPARRVAIAGPDILIASSSVTNLALLLHELATNAAKYGALSTPEGRITIECADDGERFVVTWRERGGPPLPAEDIGGEGFGSLLANATVKGQFGGDIVRDWRPEGLTVTLTVAKDRLSG